jgi:hypothetical protein
MTLARRGLILSTSIGLGAIVVALSISFLRSRVDPGFELWPMLEDTTVRSIYGLITGLFGELSLGRSPNFGTVFWICVAIEVSVSLMFLVSKRDWAFVLFLTVMALQVCGAIYSVVLRLDG